MPIFYTGQHVAIQTLNSNTSYRLQLWDSGNLGLYKTTDGGKNWNESSIIYPWPYYITTEAPTAKSDVAPFSWSYSKTVTGYKSIAYSLISANSGSTIWNA